MLAGGNQQQEGHPSVGAIPGFDCTAFSCFGILFFTQHGSEVGLMPPPGGIFFAISEKNIT